MWWCHYSTTILRGRLTPAPPPPLNETLVWVLLLYLCMFMLPHPHPWHYSNTTGACAIKYVWYLCSVPAVQLIINIHCLLCGIILIPLPVTLLSGRCFEFIHDYIPNTRSNTCRWWSTQYHNSNVWISDIKNVPQVISQINTRSSNQIYTPLYIVILLAVYKF